MNETDAIDSFGDWVFIAFLLVLGGALIRWRHVFADERGSGLPGPRQVRVILAVGLGLVAWFAAISLVTGFLGQAPR